MNRRDWLTKTSIALAGGLMLGDAVMETYDRLTHRKVWALGGMGLSETHFPWLDERGRTIWIRKSRILPFGRFSFPYASNDDYTFLANRT